MSTAPYPLPQEAGTLGRTAGAGRRRRSGPRSEPPPGPARSLYGLEIRKLWRFFWNQSPSYWLITAYLFFEYVRPQSIYSVISGYSFAAWTLYACMIAFVFEKGRKTRSWTAADTMLAVFTAVVLLSAMTAYSPAHSWANMRLYISWVIIYVLITLIVNTEKRFFVFMGSYILWCLKMSQHGARSFVTGFGSYGTSCTPGWFQNSGECGIQMTMFLPVAIFFVIALRPYWTRRMNLLALAIPLSAAMTIIATSSRGAQIGMAAIGVLLLMQVKHRVRAFVMVGLVGLLAWAVIPESQKQRFSEMGEDQTSLSRLQYWADAREIMQEYPMLGIGYKNWLPYYRTHYNAIGELPHNIFYEAGAELGFVGLFALFGLIGATLYMNRKTRRLAKRLPGGGRFAWHMGLAFDGALIGFVITGYFVTVLYYPFLWINLAMTVALHCSTEHELRRARAAQRPPQQAVAASAGRTVWRPQHD